MSLPSYRGGLSVHDGMSQCASELLSCIRLVRVRCKRSREPAPSLSHAESGANRSSSPTGTRTTPCRASSTTTRSAAARSAWKPAIPCRFTSPQGLTVASEFMTASRTLPSNISVGMACRTEVILSSTAPLVAVVLGFRNSFVALSKSLSSADGHAPPRALTRRFTNDLSFRTSISSAARTGTCAADRMSAISVDPPFPCDETNSTSLGSIPPRRGPAASSAAA